MDGSLPKGGDDAEHPTTITMDVTPPPQGRRGLWTRARACVIEDEVNSFLFEFHSESPMNQVLPQVGMLCIIRYREEAREEARTEALAPEEKKEGEGNEGGKLLDTPGA